MPKLKQCLIFFALSIVALVNAKSAEQVVDLATRPGVTQRLLVISPDTPKAVVVLFAGGHGGLQIGQDGSFGWGRGNFLVRSRQLFAENGLMTVVVDAPSDRQFAPFLTGFRQTKAHVSDIEAVITWVRRQTKQPVWLVGTSRGTQSVAYIATALADNPSGPDGIVLTSSILSDSKMSAVPAMPLEKLLIPVLLVHHELDGCSHCSPSELPALMEKLKLLPRKELLSFKGGISSGNPCEAMAYHGFNGIEKTVVTKIADWITSPKE